MRKLEPGRVAADIGAALGYLKRWPAVHGQRLGIVGFCMGGTVAIRSAGHHPEDLAAVMALYGGASLAGEADLLGRIVAPVLAFWGEQDDVYPGAGHGFFCDERASYQPAAALDAYALLTKFLRKHLN
jgi:carboxymethylenebutenolidase